jgi:hypothetical protein
MIEAKLVGGNVQESFRHLKGWYRAASETTTQPCPQTMVKQTAERVDLYRQQDPLESPYLSTLTQSQLMTGCQARGK